MCSICGGTIWDDISIFIWEKSKDRGRDDHGKIVLPSGRWIGNHRATPTTETISPLERQPVGETARFVFNGIISNDKELGIQEEEADTSVLPRIIDLSSLFTFRKTLSKIIGSFAIAGLTPKGKTFLGINYKPLWIAEWKGEAYFSSLKNHFPQFLKPWRMPPYSVMEFGNGGAPFSLSIKRHQNKEAIVICSAGLDSTAVAAYAVKKHSSVLLLHFDYSCQAGHKEKEQLKKIADYLKVKYKIVKIPKEYFGDKSPLLNRGTIPSDTISGAEYAHEWVPARNLVMLSLAVAYAEANDYGHIYLGTNLEEAGAYPDNEEQFILDFKNLLWGAVQNGVKIEVHTPLGGLMKHEIIPFGIKYNAPFHLTWSCYLSGKKHCGKCAPCFMRKTAFERNGLKDPVFNNAK